MKYRECYEKARGILAEAGILEADLDARLLLEEVCKTSRNDLLAHGDREVTEAEEELLKSLICRRAQHIPLQHLTGTQNFMGLDFKVDGHVLIPRQDTEILVEEVMKQLHDGMRLLDLCTGSGCILISLLHYSNGCSGVGVDISEDALRIARENARRLLGEDAQICFLQSDLYERLDLCGQPDPCGKHDLYGQIKGRPKEKFDRIVSNPPYIPASVISTLMPEVRDHEPLCALDGGEDGLDFYRRIIAGSGEYLVRGGMLFFEIGYNQAEAVQKLLAEGGYQEITVVQDYAGLDRVVYGTFLG